MDSWQFGVNSIDLTEDEDSRETIVGSETSYSQSFLDKQNRNFTMEQFSAASPPPLTPIPRLDSSVKPQDDGLHNVPKLTKIHRKSITQGSKSRKVRVISSTVIKPPMGDVSSEGESKMIQSEVVNQASVINCSASQNPPGKILKIKKNKRIYEYIIPHNVMPLANQTSGPVLLNIPEVGSLVISIDPQARNQWVTKNVQLEPFSLNFDEIRGASDESFNSPNIPNLMPTETVAKEGIITSTPCSCSSTRHVHNDDKLCPSRAPLFHEDLLTDKSFCWQYSKTKRKEQRVLKNLLGFSKVEVRNTNKCSRELSMHLYKKHCQLEKRKDLLRNLKELSTVKHQKTFENPSKDSVCSEHSSAPVAIHVPEGSNNFDNHHELSSSTVITPTSDFDDLLVTKKVVMLNDENVEIPEMMPNLYSATNRKHQKSKLKGELVNHQTNKKKYDENRIKPCFVRMTRCSHLDQMYLDLIKMSDTSKPSSQRLKYPKKLMSYEQMFLSRIIDTKQKFRKQMALIKPVLVLNEFNFTIVKYGVEFNKSNIVFAVNKERYFPNALLHDHTFVTAVQVGFVKLVDMDILCSYFMGELGPQGVRKLNNK